MDVKPAFCAGVAPTAGCDRRRRSGQSGLESALPGRFVVAFDFWLQRQPRANDPHASIRYWVGSWGGEDGSINKGESYTPEFRSVERQNPGIRDGAVARHTGGPKVFVNVNLAPANES